MNSFDIGITERERQVLMSALSSLEHDHLENGFSGDTAVIERLREVLSAPTLSISHPAHVIFNQTEFKNLMLVLPAATSWRLSLVDEGESYAVFAEASALPYEETDDEVVWNFDIARGLKGTGLFLELADPDLAFFQSVENKIRAGTPPNATHIAHEVIEIPLPWDFLPDEKTQDRVQGYLSHLANEDEAEDEFRFTPEVHATYLDAYAHEQPEMIDYARVLVEISWNDDGMDEIKDWIARASGVESPAPMRAAP